MVRCRTRLVSLAALWLSSLLGAACGDNLGAGAGSAADAGVSAPDAATPDAAAPDAATPDAGSPAGIDRDQSGGAPRAIELAGDLIYLGVGPRLSIWRSGKESPELVGESAALPGAISGLAVAGDRVFVSEGNDYSGRVHVIDVSDPARPVETASFVLAEPGTLTQPRGMAVLGDRLFVGDFEFGVTELDISDPDAPSPARMVPLAGVHDLVVVRDRLYYMLQSFLGGMSAGALDLENDLADMGSVSFFSAKGTAITQRDLAVAAGNDGIHVVDLTDPALPVEVFTYSLPEGGPFSRAVAVSGAVAWIPAEDGMHVLDLSDPAAITRAGPFPLAAVGANAAASAGESLAVVTDRGQLLDFTVAGADQPAARGRSDVGLCADCLGIAVDGDRVVTADFTGGLRTGRIADLSLTGRSSQPEEMVVYEDVAVAGDVAYAADWLYGLRIYDLSDPAAPALIGSVDTAGFPSSVAVSGTLVYLGESTNGGALRVIDVADPSRAREIGAVLTSQARDVEVRGDLAYVADGSFDMPGGLRIFDVSDPANMTLVGYHGESCGEALDVALSGSLAVIACSFDGFHIVDVSVPSDPILRAVVPAGGISSAWSVAAWDGGAALGHAFGVIVVDLADPAAPVTVAEHATSWTVRAMTAPGDGRLVASCSWGGVYQWALP